MPPRTLDVTTAIRLYTDEHLTLAEIGARFGVSRTAVHKVLHKAGITSEQGEHVQAICAWCEAPFTLTRGRWRKAKRVYCSDAHYFAARANPDYHQWRAGCLRARKVVGQYWTLQPGQIVHHHDGDNRHNAVENLAVFADQSAHSRHHHGGNVAPLWDGRTLQRCM